MNKKNTTKRLKHISELPAWFHIKKYDDAKNLDATGWYEQLIVRKNCQLIVSDFEKSNAYDEPFKLIRTNPIIDTTNNEILSIIFGDNILEELKPKKPNYALGVHSLTMRELYLLQNSINQEKWKHLQKWHELRKNFSNALKAKKLSRYSYRPWFDESIDNHSLVNKKIFEAIAVNLDLPDNILVEHFKQFLITQRAKNINAKTKRYRQPDFNDWIRFGVLPYLDLKIWAQETNINIPNRVMADAIYPNGEGGEETVRKTTSLLAESLISDEQLSILSAQAALEIAEQNHL